MLDEIRSQPVWAPKRAWKDWAIERDALLHRFVNEQLYPFSPYYRRLFDQHKIDPRKIRRVSDLRHIPLTSKQDIAPTQDQALRHLDFVLTPTAESVRRAAAKSLLAKLMWTKLLQGKAKAEELLRLEYSPVHSTFTTGRTALPTQFLYTSLDMERLYIIGRRLFDVCGSLAGERALNVFPFAPHLAFWQTVAAGQAATMLILHTGGGKVMGTAGNVSALERLQPHLIVGVPGYVYHLLRQASEQRIHLKNLSRIALGAERVPVGLKIRLGQLCSDMGAPNVSVQGFYGFTEARAAWGECPSGDYAVSHGYHTYPDLEIFETVDPDSGESVEPGERGELVYTTLSGRGSCVLRYRTGDIAEGGIVYDRCPGCGRAVPRISAALSRRSDVSEFQLTKIRGTLVDLNSFLPVMADMHEIIEWQLVVKKHNDDPDDLDELILYVALRDGVDAQGLKRRLCQKLLGATEVAPNQVEVLSLAEIEANLGLDTQLKEMRIRDVRGALKTPPSRH